MSNLLEETLQSMKEHRKSPSDVILIGSELSGDTYTWEEFTMLVCKEYDSSYGSTKVAMDLTIVFKDESCITREEYNGRGWWEFRKPLETYQRAENLTEA